MNNTLYKTLAFGALAGMRSLAAPALLSHFVSKDESKPLQQTPFSFLGNSTVSKVLKGLAVSEMVGDKLPSVPDRIETPSLLVRSTSGATLGAALYHLKGGNELLGAALGAAAAVAATYGSFYLRKYLCENTSLTNVTLGSLEDAVVVGSGLKASQL